jgi:hypothetical protein
MVSILYTQTPAATIVKMAFTLWEVLGNSLERKKHTTISNSDKTILKTFDIILELFIPIPFFVSFIFLIITILLRSIVEIHRISANN